MPLASTLLYVKNLLNGQDMPGNQPLLAYINPPNPDDKSGPPKAYVWTARGSENRNSGPRSRPPAGGTPFQPSLPAGWKLQTHNLSIWLTWFDDQEDPNQDSAFPAVVDQVMMILRTSRMPQNPSMVDPVTGWNSQLIDLGRNMNYEYAPIRGTASQRYNRYDAQITAPVEEWLQA